MHVGIREQKRDKLSIHKDSTAEVTLLSFLKPNSGIDLDYEICELGIEIGAGLRCHITPWTFRHIGGLISNVPFKALPSGLEKRGDLPLIQFAEWDPMLLQPPAQLRNQSDFKPPGSAAITLLGTRVAKLGKCGPRGPTCKCCRSSGRGLKRTIIDVIPFFWVEVRKEMTRG